MTDDSSIIAIGDSNNSIHIYVHDLDNFSYGYSKFGESDVEAVDITGDGEWLMGVYYYSTSANCKLFKNESTFFMEEQSMYHY